MSDFYEMLGELNADDAENLWEQYGDPDGTFRYTGQFNDWWDALRMIADGDAKLQAEIMATIREITEEDV